MPPVNKGMSSELILHHYDFSNFSEKIRLILGKKGLSWSSVEIPSFAPKPYYEPLTGGYRRTPSLQVGADIYCDTQLIAEFLEEKYPNPTIYPGESPERIRAMSLILSPWAESKFLWPLALYITGLHAGKFPQKFHEDRARLHGKPIPSLERVKASSDRNLAVLLPQLKWLESFVPGDSRFLFGDEASYADIVVYHPLHLLDRLDPDNDLLREYPKILAWKSRVLELGQGISRDLSPQDALRIAKESEPVEVENMEISKLERLKVGQVISITPAGEVSPSTGVLLSLTDKEVTIRISNDEVGVANVHFPRIGYRLRGIKQKVSI